MYHLFPLVAQDRTSVWLKVFKLVKLLRLDLFALVTAKVITRHPGERAHLFDSYSFLTKQIDLSHRADWPTHILSCENLPGRLPANQPGLTGERSIGFDIQDKLGESDSKSGDRVSNLSVIHI